MHTVYAYYILSLHTIVSNYSGIDHATSSSLWVFRFKIDCYICNYMCAYRLQGKSMFVNNDEIVLSLPDALEELILHRNCRSYNTASSSDMCKSIDDNISAVNSFTDCKVFEMFT